MNLEVEQLEEKWYKFLRFHCKEGWVDRWMGDCASNPNDDNKSGVNLNTTATYWRCDNGEWVNDYNLDRVQLYNLYEFREEFTSKEIWEYVSK